ncbi:MAG TPA: hypothetical protein EYP69_05275, partial [Bacteroidales bacterium]|nr:hypothetical protein [Bacteroidales bacterium]
MKKILLIGPRTNKNDPSNTGGAVVLFENLLAQLKQQNCSFNVIDTNKKNYTNSLIAYLAIILQIITKQTSCHVI